MTITVITPSWDTPAALGGTVRALLNQRPAPARILTVTTAPAPDLPTDPRVTTLIAAATCAAGLANAGLRAARTAAAPDEILVLLDAGSVPRAGDVLAALTAPLQGEGAAGLSGGFARGPDGRYLYDEEALRPPLLYNRSAAALYATTGRLLAEPHQYPAGYVLAAPAATFARLGDLDEGYASGYFEFADLWTRAAALGLATRFVPTLALTCPPRDGDPPELHDSAVRFEADRLRYVLRQLDDDTLEHQFWPAERRQLAHRLAGHTARVLVDAYARTLDRLPAPAGPHPRPEERRARAAHTLREMRQHLLDHEPPPPARPRFAEPVGRSPAPALPQLPHAAPRPPFATGGRPPVTIIILTWNGLAYTQRCLQSLRAHTAEVDYRVVVVDNQSTDGTPEWLETQDGVTLIRNATNEGYVRGNNRALRTVPADHDVLLLNNDVRILHDDWLARLRAVANDHPDYGVLGCKQLMPDGRLLHTGTAIPQDTYWGYQIGSNEAYLNQYPGINEVEGVVGACMYIRRDARATLGLLDEAFFSYFEDTDYCLRAWQHGFKVACVNDVRLIHYQGVSSVENKADWNQMFKTSQATFVAKWGGALAARYTRRLVWQSLVTPPTGYALSSRELLLALDQAAVDVRYSFVLGANPGEGHCGDPRIEQLRARAPSQQLPQVLYSQGDLFHKNAGRYKVGFTMLETSGIPRAWVAQANEMDEVWVPSRFNRETFTASGVTRPIHVIPLGVNPDYYHPGIRGRRASPRYTFLSVFEWGERKAPELLLRAFTRAFTARDDVLLIVKVLNTDGAVRVRQLIDDLGRPAAGPPIAVLHNHVLKGHQMAALYRSADCFVLPTRGEGWGMPILEAMACGLPVIATDWSAQTEFLHAGNGYPLRIKGLIPAVAKCPYYQGFQWADPDEEHLVHLLRHVHAHPDEARAIGRRAAEEAATRWTWAHSAARIIARLDQFPGGTAPL